jgi:UPF0716 protein FxsA
MPTFLILLLPLAEIAAFIVVGNAIGLAATLALVVASSILGFITVRDAGLVALLRLERRQDAASILSEVGRKGLAGFLLIIPGFLTDIAAFALLAPVIGPWLANAATAPRGRRPSQAAAPVVLDGDYRRIE